MEKFYIVKPDSKLHQEYWEWRNSVSENNKAIVDFFNENGISAIQYYSSKECLGIIPTDEDKEKFEKQFTKYAVDGGLRLFKKNSKIGKAWIAFTSTMTFKNRPSPAWYNKFFVGRSSSRLFDYNGVLYASMDAEKVEMPESIFDEINGSEFYKIMEEMTDD